MMSLGATRASLDRNSLSNMAAGAGSILGAIVSIGVGIYATKKAVEASGKIDEEMLKMQQDAKLEEQRKQAKDIKTTPGFLSMAKAISANAGLAMAFRPDLVNVATRDDAIAQALEYLAAIEAGTADPRPIPEIIKLLVSAGSSHPLL